MTHTTQMPQRATVSVVVPIYNAERTLGDCLASVERQVYDDIELILVDDGSTDSSGSIVDEHRSRFGAPIVIHKENGGLSSARNEGIAVATGEYIALVDADDVISPLFISTLVGWAECMGCGLVTIRSASRFPENGDPPVQGARAREIGAIEVSAGNYLQEILNHRADMGAQFRLYRASLLKRVGFTEGLLFEDFDLLNRLLPEVDRVCIIDDSSLYAYRLSSNGIIAGKYSSDKTRSMCVVADGLMRVVRQHWPSLVAEAQSYCFTTFRMIFAQMPCSHADERVCWQRLAEYRAPTVRNAAGRMGDRLSAVVAYGGKMTFRMFCSLCRWMGLMR